MKKWEELENMTLWEIDVNEGALTMLVLSIMHLFLFVMCLHISASSKIKFLLRRLRTNG